jgi:hypothetical protein
VTNHEKILVTSCFALVLVGVGSLVGCGDDTTGNSTGNPTGGIPLENEECAGADSECVGGDQMMMPGTCLARVGVGASCESAPCTAGNYCDANICAPLKESGEACASPFQCKDDLYCDGATSMCAARKAGGEACTTSSQCQSLSCDITTNTCTGSGPLCDGM